MTEECMTLSARALRGLDSTDVMTPELRACVHEYGYAIVYCLVDAGITKPAHIRSIVHTIWMGAREPHQKHGSTSGRLRSPVIDSLDWILIQAKASITAATLLRFLWSHSMVIVPREPSTVMVNASIDAVKYMDRVTKQQKHRNRLRAAIDASTARLWPQIDRSAK